MVVLTSTACRRISCYGRRKLLLDLQPRPFHSGFVSCLDDAVTVKASHPSVTITRKKFSELPKRRVVAEEHSLLSPSAKLQNPSDASVPNDLVIPSCAQFRCICDVFLMKVNAHAVHPVSRLNATEHSSGAPERGVRNTQGLDAPSQQGGGVEEEQPRKRSGRRKAAVAESSLAADTGTFIPQLISCRLSCRSNRSRQPRNYRHSNDDSPASKNKSGLLSRQRFTSKTATQHACR